MTSYWIKALYASTNSAFVTAIQAIGGIYEEDDDQNGSSPYLRLSYYGILPYLDIFY